MIWTPWQIVYNWFIESHEVPYKGIIIHKLSFWVPMLCRKDMAALAHSVQPVLRFWVLRLESKFVTDRQTNSLTPYTGICGFFLSAKFVTSRLALLAGGLSIMVQFMQCLYAFEVKPWDPWSIWQGGPLKLFILPPVVYLS